MAGATIELKLAHELAAGQIERSDAVLGVSQSQPEFAIIPAGSAFAHFIKDTQRLR